MSLLIKALEKAEQGKTADGVPELSLEERASSPSQPDADSLRKAQTKQASQQAAATVFNAKNEKNPKNKNKVLWVSVAVLLAVAVVGMQFYAYLNALTKPDVIMARAPVSPSSVLITESSPPVAPAPTSLVPVPVAGEAAAGDIKEAAQPLPSSVDAPNNTAATDQATVTTQPALAASSTTTNGTAT